MAAISGSVSATPIHSLRVMFTNSGLAKSLLTTTGSSAIPQIGQSPGPSLSTSGSIGQVYLPLYAAANGSLGCSGHPHCGHGPGFAVCTSACMGQLYLPASADGMTTKGRCASC